MTTQRKRAILRGKRGNMKRPQSETAELEAELLRLNALVRERRKQLARLEYCPHNDCECRRVWNEITEKKLARQVGNIRQKVKAKRRRTIGTSRPAGGGSRG